MALVFDSNNIKVDFLSEALDNSSDKFNTKTILFPVFRYKVLAPIIDDLKLNVFQKNTLSILNKGNYDIQKIATLLRLEPQLIKMVISELEQRGLTSNGKITQSGRDLIEGRFSWFNSVDNIRKDIYYIYQDIYTKKLYPVFMKFDPSNDYFEYTDKKIHKKSKGKDIDIFVTLIEPRGVNFNKIQEPEVYEVFEMIDEQNEIKNKQRISPPSLIKFLDKEPTLSYLATTLYVNKNASELDDIKAMDPFNREDIAYWLMDSLKKASLHNEKLKEIFEKLVIDAKEEKREQISEALNKIHKDAIDIVNITFGSNLKSYKHLYNALEEFYRDLKLYEYHNDGKYLKEAFKNSQTVLETLFDIIYVENKKGYDDILKDDVIFRNLSVEELKSKVLTISPESNLLKWNFYFDDFDYKIIAGALNNKAQSLRPRYIASILVSLYDKNNPMYKLLNQKSDLLPYLEMVARGRNAAGHKYKEIPDYEIGNYYDEVLSVKDGLEEIINIFLEGE